MPACLRLLLGCPLRFAFGVLSTAQTASERPNRFFTVYSSTKDLPAGPVF